MLFDALHCADSLTARAYEQQGWGAALQDLYRNRAMVQPAGFGGFNTRMAVAMLDTLLPRGSKHMVVVVWFGANDAALPTERVAIPKAEYAANLRQILERATSVAEHTVIITTPPVDAAGRLEYQQRKYGDKASGTLERTPAQAEAFRVAAAEIFGGDGSAGCDPADYGGRASVLNPWAKMQAQPGWGARFLCDGLHFTGEGQAFVFAELESHLRAVAPHLYGSNPPPLAVVALPRVSHTRC